MSDLPNDWPTEWRDPQKVAREIDDHARGDGQGVWRDSVTEAMVEAESASKQLGDIHVICDSILDHSQVLPTHARATINGIHEDTKQLSRYYAAIETELTRLLKDGH